MDRFYLIKTAKYLKPVSEKGSLEYLGKQEQLVLLMNDKMLNRSDIHELVGRNNLEMMKDNHANHARFMVSLFENFNPEILVDTVLWVFRAYRSRNFHSNYWAAQLNGWIEILKEELSESTFTEIFPYYEWMQVNIPVFVKLSAEDLKSGKSQH
ncbi:MAG: hypothetical protein V2I54_05350 [Bacteroidales bacterium]|jgi:hypothetical protein|nr:hypothetical protein [Bacteroidales bacterium]